MGVKENKGKNGIEKERRNDWEKIRIIVKENREKNGSKGE